MKLILSSGRRMRSALLLMTLANSFLGKSQAVQDGSIRIGKVDSVWSSGLNEKRYYWVYTPPSYNNNSICQPKKYPVLYVLDGEAHFLSLVGQIQYLSTGINGNHVIPEMIIIAISNTDRVRDLTPTHTDKGINGEPSPMLRSSGGMANFFKFLNNELIPHVDFTYRTSAYRILIGHSFGGLAVINALYTIPGTFNAYITADPSLYYDNQVLLKNAKNYFTTADLKNKVFYVGQANTVLPGETSRNIHFRSIEQFDSIMKHIDHSGVQYGYRYYPNEDHGSAPLITVYDGLRVIFDGYNIKYMGQPVSFIKQHFQTISNRLGCGFLPGEEDINNLGYQSLQRGDTTYAIELLQMNADNYPQSYNVWDSLGDVWMMKGNYKKSIIYFEKSLALNPKNQGAKDCIKKMKEKVK